MPRGIASSLWYLFRQQRLPATQPFSDPFRIIVWLLFTAFLFIPLGTLLTFMGNTTGEITFRYDHIHNCTAKSNQGAFIYSGNGKKLAIGCKTRIYFRLNETMRAPVYLYYGLTQFYQNHRRLADSKSPEQLHGLRVSPASLKKLFPLLRPGELTGMKHTPIKINETVLNYSDFIYSPAGLLPWSMFNDTFALYRVLSKNENLINKSSNLSMESVELLICNDTAFSKVTNEPLEEGIPQNGNAFIGEIKKTGGKGCRKKGIARRSDVLRDFKPIFFSDNKENPTDYLVWSAPRNAYYEKGSSFLNNTHISSPSKSISNDSYFNEGWYAGELGHAIPYSTDEDLMVWVRLAPSPKFRKLRRIIEVDLIPGEYLMEIGEHYDSVSFGGKKSFTLATISYLGGHNFFLAKLCLAIGLTSIAVVLVFCLLRRQYKIRVARELEHLHKIN